MNNLCTLNTFPVSKEAKKNVTIFITQHSQLLLKKTLLNCTFPFSKILLNR